MNEKLLSIVIPFYNVERFIATCLSSILDNTYASNLNSIEIILVDDKSEDNSLELATVFQLNYPEIIRIVKHEHNMGLGAARNSGIENASAAYITFIDSDDWYAPGAINYLLSQLLYLSQNDIMLFGLEAIKEDQVSWQYLPYEKIGAEMTAIQSSQALELFSRDRISPSATNKVFGGNLIRSLRFRESTYYEDLEFTPRALSKCNLVMILNVPLLKYRIEGSSITRQETKAKHVFDLGGVLESLRQNISPGEYVTNIFLNRWAFGLQYWQMSVEIFIRALSEMAKFLISHEVTTYEETFYSKLNKWLDIHYQQFRSNEDVHNLYWKVVGLLSARLEKCTPLFSIVIPVYNARSFLDKTIESLSGQKFSDFEVIFVDDASSDGSGELLERLSQEYDFIRYRRLSRNSGAGVARNAGLSEARGTYILFNDADDSLEPDALQLIADELALKDFPDLLVFGFSVLNEDRNFLWGSEKIESLPDELCTGEEVFRAVCSSVINPAPWNKVFKRAIWADYNITFPHTIHHQDLSAIPYACYKCTQATILKKRLYNYTINAEGVTRTVTDKHVTSPFGAIDKLFNFFKSDSSTSFDKWFDELIELAIETFRYNLELRKAQFSNGQLAQFVTLFNEFCSTYKIEPVILLNCKAGVALVAMMIRERTRRGLQIEVNPYHGADSFELLFQHHRIINQQLQLQLSAAHESQNTESARFAHH